ncbi:MAG: transposase [Candidatus Marinimicrobia bacterium]|nr:transposase [Candidatus Neomarinimicrobiota bacterium]
MPWKERTKMDEKRFLIKEYLTHNYSITELSERFGISRPIAYKYIERFKSEGWEGLEARSSRPHHFPTKTPIEIEKQILDLRKKRPRYGARKLKAILERENATVTYPPRSTINSILSRHNLTNQPKRRRRIKPKHVYSVAKYANDIWTTDYKGDFKMGDGKRCYPLTLCDMYSRYIIGIQGMYTTNLKDAKAFYIRVFKEYGLPDSMLSDNGVPFAAAQALARLTRLSAWWIRLGITPIFIDPASPAQNGKHERMHRELKADTAKPPASNLQSQQRKFNRFTDEYNTYRPHEALNDDVPAQHYGKSNREYTDKIKPYEYPDTYIVKYVSKNGAVRWPGNKWLYVSTSISGYNIGLNEIDNGLYCVWYHNVRLGYLNERKLRIEDYRGRLKRNML